MIKFGLKISFGLNDMNSSGYGYKNIYNKWLDLEPIDQWFEKIK